MYIYAGGTSRYTEKYGSQPRIQLNDVCNGFEVGAFVLSERFQKTGTPKCIDHCLKVDGDTKVRMISTSNKSSESKCLKINYTTRVGDYSQSID